MNRPRGKQKHSKSRGPPGPRFLCVYDSVPDSKRA